MNLEIWSKSTIIINAAFNYASENNYAFLTPLNLLEVMLKTSDEVRSTLVHFSIDLDKLYSESQQISKNSKKKKQHQETGVQGNILALMEQAQNEAKNYFKKQI